MFSRIPQNPNGQESWAFAQQNPQRMLMRSNALPSSICEVEDFEEQLNLWMHAGGQQENRIAAKASIVDTKQKHSPILNLENFQLSSLPDCFAEGFEHLYEVRLHGNALESFPPSLGELLNKNTQLSLHGLAPSSNAALVGQSMMSKLKNASASSSRRQKAVKTMEWIAPRYAERRLIRALEAHSSSIKNEQLQLMRLSTFNELVVLSTQLGRLREQFKFAQPRQYHLLQQQLQQVQTRFNVLFSLQKQFHDTLGNSSEAESIAPPQFDALRIQYMVANKLLSNVLTRRELHAFEQFHLKNPQGVLTIGSNKDVQHQTQFELNENTVEWIGAFLGQQSGKLTVDKLFARAMCCVLPKRPKVARKQQAKAMLEATWETLSKLKLKESKHKKSERHETKSDSCSSSDGSEASDPQGEDGDESASWKAELAEPLVEFLRDVFMGAGEFIGAFFD